MRLALVFVSSEETLSAVRRSLQDSFRIFVCSSSAEASEAMARENPEVLLVDLGLEEAAGLEFCARVRRESRFNPLPLLFLSSVRDTSLTVRAFEAGCDDLVHVPCAPEEMRARVEARFRRCRAQPMTNDLYWRADLRFSLATQRVVCTDAADERDLELTPNEFKILYLLARNEGRTLSRQMILAEVWGENLHVVERTVDKHICSLRRKMADRAQYVQSVPGSGYCFSPSPPSVEPGAIRGTEAKASL